MHRPLLLHGDEQMDFNSDSIEPLSPPPVHLSLATEEWLGPAPTRPMPRPPKSTIWTVVGEQVEYFKSFLGLRNRHEKIVGDNSLPSRFRVPSWMVSLVVHLLLILCLAIEPIRDSLTAGNSITADLGDSERDGDQGLSMTTFGQAEEPSLQISESASLLEDGIAAPQLNLKDVGGSPEIPMALKGPGAPTAIEIGVSGRTGAMKSSLLKAYGGTAGTESAVAKGLEWLAKQQRKDGSWSLRGPFSSGGVNENSCSATAMALLAFLGAGHTHRDGQYRDQISKGLYYLLQLQDKRGFFATTAPDRQQMYAQAQATIVLCELMAMSKDESLRTPVTKAIRFAELAQSRQGGWRYEPNTDSDVSVTGWFVMALMSAKSAGIRIDDSILKNVSKYLDTMGSDEGAKYSYSYVDYPKPSVSMTAEALLCRQYLGWQHYDPRTQRGANYLLTELVDAEGPERSYYYWYYATQMLHHFGGAPWEKWNNAMRESLPKAQVKDGREAGSWSPEGDRHGISGGRLYSTCFSIYCLEVYYRHLPLYDF